MRKRSAYSENNRAWFYCCLWLYAAQQQTRKKQDPTPKFRISSMRISLRIKRKPAANEDAQPTTQHEPKYNRPAPCNVMMLTEYFRHHVRDIFWDGKPTRLTMV